MYKPINGWTKDSIIVHVLNEFKGRSMSSGGGCKYRGPNGTKCAVGMFIPDSEYTESLDNDIGNVVTVILDQHPHLNAFMPLTMNAMRILQRQHDYPSVSDYSKDPTDEETFNAIFSWIDENVEDDND